MFPATPVCAGITPAAAFVAAAPRLARPPNRAQAHGVHWPVAWLCQSSNRAAPTRTHTPRQVGRDVGGHGQAWPRPGLAAQRTTARQRRAAQCRALRVLGAVRNFPAPRAFRGGSPSAAAVGPPRTGGGGTPPRRRGAGRRTEPPARRSPDT
jgi:hypothetical protein